MASFFARLSLLIASAALVSSCSQLLTAFSFKPDDSVIQKSVGDPKAYRYLELDNDVRVVLVSDSKSSRAAASMRVDVGSADDPWHRQGLAHFLEHMLFLGTDEFPQAGEYQKFIATAGGSHNAYTSFDHTNYFFELNSDSYDEALARFSAFFKSPTFDETYVQREKNAVEAEYRLKIRNEGRRIADVTRALINPKHPFAKFSVGNLQTLTDTQEVSVGADLMTDLRAFYKQHYFSQNMQLALYSPLSLDEMESLAKKYFSETLAKNSTSSMISEPFLQATSERPSPSVFVAVEALKPARALTFSFPMPDLTEEALNKPTDYIANILGHEGEGSMFQVLKQKDLVTSISAGLGLKYDGGSLFSVSISLTEKGLGSVAEIWSAFEHTIDLIKAELELDEASAQGRYQEVRQLAQNDFRFYQSSRPTSTVVRIANNMSVYPTKYTLLGDYSYNSFNKTTVSTLLESIHIDNVFVLLASDELSEKLEFNQKTNYYAARYRVLDRTLVESRKLPERVLKEINLPAENPFIAKNFPVHGIADVSGISKVESNTYGTDSEPIALSENPNYAFWLLPDDEFNLPQLQLNLSFLRENKALSAQHQVLEKLLVAHVNERLSSYVYPALLAGASVDFYSHLRGFSLAISGYNDSLQLLLPEVISELRVESPDDQRFERIKRRVEQGYRYRQAASPIKALSRKLASEIITARHPIEDLLAALDKIDEQMLIEFSRDVFDGSYIEAMLAGNVDDSSVHLVERYLKRLATCDCVQQLPIKVDVQRLAKGEPVIKHITVDHEDAAMVWLFQSDGDSDTDYMGVALLAELMHPDYFSKLRTEKQLAYNLSASFYPQYTQPNIKFALQSPSASTKTIVDETAMFIQAFIQNLSEASFEKQRQAILAQFEQPDRNLSARANRLWRSRAYPESDFARRDRLKKALQAMRYEQWRESVGRMLDIDSSRSLLMLTD